VPQRVSRRLARCEFGYPAPRGSHRRSSIHEELEK
jgi:hypothetical protein